MSPTMMWVFAVLVVLAMGAIAMLAAGRGQPMAPAYDDRPDSRVPADRPLTGRDLRAVRFPLALRGYRMAEVDALLERLASELDERALDAHGVEDEEAAATAEDEPPKRPDPE
jgi:DivIVA domain-containing protein